MLLCLKKIEDFFLPGNDMKWHENFKCRRLAKSENIKSRCIFVNVYAHFYTYKWQMLCTKSEATSLLQMCIK